MYVKENERKTLHVWYRLTISIVRGRVRVSLRNKQQKCKSAIFGQKLDRNRKRNFEALRGRFWKKSKLQSFRKSKILGSNADRFWKLSSKGFQIWENPRLVVPDLVHGQNHFNKSFEQFKSRIWFWWKKESCRKLWDLQLSWRKHFQIQNRFWI